MRIRKKILSVVLSLVLAIGLCSGTAFIDKAEAASNGFTTNDVTRLIPTTYNGSGQCQGYAKYIGKLLTGVEPCGGATDAKKYGNNVNPNPGWTKYTSISAAGGLRVGDFIRIPTPDGYGHAAIITSVGSGSDPAIKVTEKWGSNTAIKNGNLNGNKGIRGKLATQSQINTNGIYYILRWTKSNPTPTAKAPTIKPNDVLGGKKIQLVDNQGGATIRYTLDGKTDPTASSGTVYNGSWINDNWQTMGVRALATKSGMNTSGVTRQTVTTGLTANPYVNQSDTASGTTIELKSDTKAATIFYTLDGTNPTFDIQSGTSNGKKYTGAFSLTENCTVKAIAVASGMRVSSVMSKVITCTAPGAPTPRIEADKIAQGDTAKVTWDRNPAAASYTATLYQNGQPVDTQTTTAPEAVFVLSGAGTYSIGVKATNAIGSSPESSKVNVEAIAPLTVRFTSTYTDENGNQISRIDNEQLVKYGSDATQPSDPPRRRGYTFSGWLGQTTNITKDTTITSAWRINEYKVKFYSADGKTLLSQQDIQFNDAATAPDPGAAPTGKVFSGWAVTDADDDSLRDFNKVDSNLTLRAVFAWADEELPVVAEITKAERTASGNYTVHVKLTNHPTDISTALLRVALKTSGDKLVQTSRETVEISTDGTIEKDVVLKYNGDNVATVAEVEVVGLDGNYRTGGAYSKAVQKEVVSMDNFYYTDWSEWSTEKPTATDTVEVEEATQYRSRDKQFTKSTATALSGWNRGTATTTYGGWSGNMSTTSKPAASDTLQITGQSTKYTYYRWCNWYDNCRNQDSVAYGSDRNYHEVTLNSPMAACPNKFGDKGGKAWDLHGPYGSCAHRKAGISYWWTKSTVTTYTYQTRSKTVTYDYSQWGTWSDWGFDEVTGTTNREVQTQKVYRYRTKQPGSIQGTEDTTGTKQTVTGKLSTGVDLSGKEATIMVYNVTNSDPNEDQMQYIGQTVLGADNAYEFSFTPRQDPSVESGDFIVSLGVKGSTGLVNVATIKAPRAQYTVKYQYEKPDGSIEVVSEQQVSAGDDAVAPEAPTREGCQFLGWSRAASGVDRDLVVNALFTERTCTIAWVDHEAEDVFLQTVPYGSALVAPTERTEVEGYVFKGWDALEAGTTQATDNMVIKAMYETEKHTVMFVNYDGSAFKTMQVEHGKAAPLPDINPTAPGMEFVSWGTTSQTPWWCVTKDLVVKPLFAYEGTVSSPYSSVELADGYVGAKGAKVYLETPTDGSTILYTVDGSDPEVPVIATFAAALGTGDDIELPSENDLDKEPGVTYVYDPDEGITVTNAVTIRAMACMSGMNDSSITEIPVEVTATNDLAHAEMYLTSAPYYYGTAVEPGILVSFGDELLTYGEDYTVSYANNSTLGSATAIIKGKGAYTGQQTLEFSIILPPPDSTAGPSGGTDADTPNTTQPTTPTPGSNGTTNQGSSGAQAPGSSSGKPNAAASTPAAPISVANASLSANFAGKNKKPTITVRVAGQTLKNGTDYTVSCGKAKKVGSKVKVTIVGKGAYTGKKTATIKVAKGLNTLTVKAKKKAQTMKFAKVKSRAQTISRPLTVKKAVGKVTYKNVSSNKTTKAFRVNTSTGAITVPKATKKGTYLVKVKATAKGNASYKAGSKTVAITIRVK